MRKRSLVWLGLVLVAAGCVQILDGAYDYKPLCEEDPTCVSGEACSDDTNCDDPDQCTVDRCGENKTCVYTPIDGVAPEQKAGDCKQGFCDKGVFTEKPDDTDLPDDLESCTTDGCSNGTPIHDKLPDGTMCSVGPSAGLCLSGVCVVECSQDKPCNDGNPCTEDSCNASTGRCNFAILDGLPTPFYVPVVGDCSQQICINGVSTAIADNFDIPDDNNFCTRDTCENGMPTFTPTNANAACLPDGSGICDAMGNCLECMSPNQCPPLPVDNGCHIRTCTDNKCGDMLVTAGMDVDPNQGDCKGKYCDAMGNPTTQNNDTDVPNDNNPCTKNMCTNGMPSNPLEPVGTSCNGTSTCDGLGSCGCTLDVQCGTSDECKTYTCVTNKCKITYAPQGKPLVMQTPGDCKVNACDGAGNAVSAIDTMDLPMDGNDCTVDICSAAGMPLNPPVDLGVGCGGQAGMVCNGFGLCLKDMGVGCMDAAECARGFCVDSTCCADACTGECLTCNATGSAGRCTNVASGGDDAPLCTGTNSCDGMGICKRDNGQPCGMNTDCTSGFCADGVCCNSACTETCKSCNLTASVGTCTFVPNDSVDPTGTSPCNNPYRCNGTGLCNAQNGVPCALPSECLSGFCVDGFCCGNICDQLCKACSDALTGAGNGNCRSILNGTDPQNECSNSDCNGSGACSGLPGTLANGQSCTSAGQCLSGFCVDGVCCNQGCTQSCKTCNLAGSVGTCVNVPNSTADMNGNPPCTTPSQCDGNGVCKGLNGVACNTGTECLSGFCADGFCCGNICNQLCRSCAATLNGGADGVCGNTKVGLDPDNECATSCNGAGMCAP